MNVQFKKIAVALSVLGALGASSSAIAAGTLVYCSDASPAGFDVAQFTAGTDFDAGARTMFDSLLAYKPGTTEMIPALAEKWTISEDGKTYTFQLRAGVKFHTTDYFTPTRDLQAEDVIFTFGRMIKKDHPSNQAYPAQFPYAGSLGLDSNILSIKKIDNLTVEFKLKEVDAPFLAKIAMDFASVQSVEYAQKLANAGRLAEINQKPIGTGPFVFSNYTKDETIRYAANPNYWNKAAVQLDKLIFSINKEASVRYQKLKKGECDILAYPNPSDVAEMKKDASLKVDSAPGFSVGYVAYNTQKAEMQKREVRQALDMAINRKAIVDAVYQGQGQEATNPFPPSLWSYNTTLKNAPVDVTKAKALLAKAGYPNGFETELWAMPVQRAYNPNAKLMAEMIQADWAKIGVKTKIVSFEWGEYLKRARKGEHTAGLFGWLGDFADPDNFLGVLLTCKSVGGPNYAQYCSPEFDALINKAVRTTDVAERTKLYEAAQVIFKRDLPWTTIAHSTVNQPMRKAVMGFKISPFGNYDFRYVSKSE